MQEINMPIAIATALIPLLIGFIWYNPKVLGKVWMKEAGITEDTMKGANMALIFGVSLIFSFFLSMGLQFMVIHQFHLGSIVMGEPDAMNPNSAAQLWVVESMAKYGHTFKTFKHGAFHGIIAALFVALPVLGINALFERKSFKYIFVNLGYWVITFALMGGVICQFSN